MFLVLLGVSGIGPRLALAILSSLTVSDISSAIRTSDDSKLCTIPGIGRKTAARMVLELKDKIKLLPSTDPSQNRLTAGPDHVDDAISALVNLGYKKTLAEEALRNVRQGRAGLAVEELIREALNALMKR